MIAQVIFIVFFMGHHMNAVLHSCSMSTARHFIDALDTGNASIFRFHPMGFAGPSAPPMSQVHHLCQLQSPP